MQAVTLLEILISLKSNEISIAEAHDQILELFNPKTNK